ERRGGASAPPPSSLGAASGRDTSRCQAPVRNRHEGVTESAVPNNLTPVTSNPHRWRILAVVATAFFMTILDVSIVNVALPSIGRSLHFTRENLQWVITAYAIAFGGFLLLGGEWIFFVNVPVGAVVLALTARIVPESRREGPERHYDVLGAVLVSGGLALLVYTISKAPDVGWATARTILLLIASGALLVGFLVNERRLPDPLMPFHIFRVRTVAGANTVGALLGAVLFANFFLLTLYVQNVLGYSALKTG